MNAALHPAASRCGLAAPLLALACAGPGEPPVERPLPPEVTVRVRGHQDVGVGADGSLTPRWLSPSLAPREQEIGLCLDAPPERDTSRWRVQIRLPGDAEGDAAAAFEPYTQQAGTAVCFGRRPPAEMPSSPGFEVCATLLDAFDGSRYRIPCFRAAYEADGAVYDAELRAGFGLLGRFAEWPPARRVAELERHAAGVAERGYPFLALQLQLVIADQLRRRGTPEALAELGRRLSDLPAWLEREEATAIAALVRYERAMLEIARGRYRGAWEQLAAGEDLARRVAASHRVAIAMRQAEILTRLGAGREPIERLRAVLDECASWPCDPRLEPSARGLLGWLLLLDPDAGPGELDEAAGHLEAAVPPAADPLEEANRLLNVALLASRRGDDAAPVLAAARALLASAADDAGVREDLAWADLFEGLDALRAGGAERAVELCRSAAAPPSPSRLAAWAWSCQGRAHRRLGAAEAAAAAFDQAILRHALATPAPGADRPPAPGHRVDDYYRAARLAVERGDPRRAWEILETLDHGAIDAAAACEEESEAVRTRLEARRRALFGQLALTGSPQAPERRRQLEPVRRSMMRQLSELQRGLLADCRRPLAAVAAPADVRAFALPGEVVLLWRSGGGVSAKSTRGVSRRDLRRRLERLAAAQGTDDLDDAAWRRLLRPFAAALVPPDPESLGAVTRFALHGLLQRVPLAALPVDAAGGRWLGELTTPVLRPAVAEAAVPGLGDTARSPLFVVDPQRNPSRDAGTRSPLFVVDPQRNLASGAGARDLYRELFAGARILYGAEATLGAVRSTLAEAAFLHIDAHGVHDPAFPELSGLEMADGRLTLVDFAGFSSPEGFVHLAGCHTGSAAETGDSGRYGLAGALAGGAAAWVVASRSAVGDLVVRDFNRVFYRRIAGGQGVPAAFAAAAEALRLSHPATAWSNLVLLGAGGEVRPAAGQNRRRED